MKEKRARCQRKASVRLAYIINVAIIAGVAPDYPLCMVTCTMLAPGRLGQSIQAGRKECGFALLLEAPPKANYREAPCSLGRVSG
jgi:hypothetical protein